MRPEQAPKRIFLQNDDYDYAFWGDASWCEDPINDGDVEYIRADLAAHAEPEPLPPQQRDDLVRELLGLLEKIKALEGSIKQAAASRPTLSQASAHNPDLEKEDPQILLACADQAAITWAMGGKFDNRYHAEIVRRLQAPTSTAAPGLDQYCPTCGLAPTATGIQYVCRGPDLVAGPGEKGTEEGK